MTHLLALFLWFGAIWFLTLAVAVAAIWIGERTGLVTDPDPCPCFGCRGTADVAPRGR